MEKRFTADALRVRVFDTREEMGSAAAADIAACVKSLLEKKQTINMIFAAAPSQNEVLHTLANDCSVPWERVRAFHMDEYIGLPADAPQRFGRFLNDRLFSKVPFLSVEYLHGDAEDISAECARYGALLTRYPADIVVLGIGENGHIAFNDPGTADFSDPMSVKEVKLDAVCRQQQVNDGCFDALDQVPASALTLTVPALFGAQFLFCIVPSKTKASAVYDTVYGTIDEHCPASILRRHQNAVLYLDKESASKC